MSSITYFCLFYIHCSGIDCKILEAESYLLGAGVMCALKQTWA